MKTLRVIHFLFGVASLAVLFVIAWVFMWPSFQAAESSRVEAVQKKLQAKLDAYHEANGQYPDSLQVLVFTNSPQEIRMLSDIRKMSYHYTHSGYALSYEGACRYTLSVSTTR